MRHRLFLLLLLSVFLPPAIVQASTQTFFEKYDKCDVVIDGIAYRLDSEKIEAAVTFFTRKNHVTKNVSEMQMRPVYYCNYEHNYDGMQYRGDVVIPEEVEFEGVTYTVTSIDTHAFDGCKEMTGLLIPQSVYYDYAYWNGDTKEENVYDMSVIDSYSWRSKYENGTLCLWNYNPDGPDTNRYKDPFPWLLEQPAGTVIYHGDEVALVTNQEWYETDSQRDGRQTVTADAVQIKEGSKTILSYAAAGLSATRVELPSSLTQINAKAFYQSEITDDMVMPNVTTIGDSAFYKAKLANVLIPDATTIGNSAFFEAKLGNISMPNVEKIGISAFRRSNLTALDQTPFLKTVGDYAFDGCTSLTDVTLPNSLRTIGNNTFSYCSSLTDMTLPNSLRTIGYNAFSGCGIKEIVIPYSVSRIASKAFLGCSNLERATIPVTVEDIGSEAFPKTEITITGNGECTYLKKIQYPPTFVNVGCGITGVDRIYSNVERVNSYPETPPTISEYVDWNTSPGELHVPASALAAYFTAPDWQKFTSMKGDLVGRVKLEQTEALMLKSDELQLSAASVAPEGSALVWGTTNPDVATVDENGKVTATGVGECDIYASLADNLAIYTACHIDVHNRVAIALPAEALTARLNTIVAVTPTFDPEPTDITVTSSDPAVAIVRLINAPAGAAAHAPVTGPKIFQVLGLKQGQAIITVASADGISQPASINVTVIDNFPQGDVDCNRVVNGSDVTALYNSLLDDTAGPAGAPAIFTTRLDGTPLLDADVDGNGVVNGSDVTVLYNLLLK